MLTPCANEPENGHAEALRWSNTALLLLDSCPDCIAQQGLCARHSREILPQLAVNGGWLRLMGEALTEQRGRQTRRTASVSPEGRAFQARQLAARQAAKSKRRGYFGLARAIAEAK